MLQKTAFMLQKTGFMLQSPVPGSLPPRLPPLPPGSRRAAV